MPSASGRSRWQTSSRRGWTPWPPAPPDRRSSWTPVVARVAVLGAGRMGGAVARKVAGAGHDVPLWNRTRATAEAVAEGHERLVVADTAAEAVAGADAVLTMMATGAATCEVLLADDVQGAYADDVVV